MAHDFAKTRARKAAPEQKHPAPAPQPAKGMLMTGLLTGLILGFFSFFLVYLTGVLPPVGAMTGEPANPADAEELAAAQQRRNEELELAAARLQLEFYKELPNYEVVVDNPSPQQTGTGNTLTATASAIANIAANAAATTDATTVAETTPPAVTAEIAEITPPAPSATAARPGEPSFMVQAGAFQQEAAAVAQSMRLNALGLDARVKKEALLGKTLFLVQAGPYYSRDELTQAERVLRSNSIDSMRIGVSQ